MNRLIFTACLTLLLGSSAVHAEDETDIRRASQEWVNTYNSNDWPALGLLFTADAKMMPPNSPAVVGRQAIVKWEAANETGFQIAFDIKEIKIVDDIAFIQGRSCIFIPLEDGSRGIDIGKFLEVRERQSDGRWLITHDIFNSDMGVNGPLSSSCPFKD